MRHIETIDFGDPDSLGLLRRLHSVGVDNSVLPDSGPEEVDLEDNSIDFRLRLASIPMEARFESDVASLLAIRDKGLFKKGCQSYFETLEDQDFHPFMKLFLVRVLEKMTEVAQELPEFSLKDLDVYFTNQVIDQVGAVRDETDVLLMQFSTFSDLADSRSPLANDLCLSLYHDQRSKIVNICCMISPNLFEREGPFAVPEWVKAAEKHKNLLVSIYQSYLSLITDTFELGEADLLGIMEAAAIPNSMYFNTSFEKGTNLAEAGPGKILHDFPKNLTFFGNADSIVLALFNYIKNSLKIGKSMLNSAATKALEEGASYEESREISDAPNPVSVYIGAHPFGDNSIAFEVSDTGVGISYDQSMNDLTATAMAKQAREAPMNELERTALDEQWRSHIPPVALQSRLFERGKTLNPSSKRTFSSFTGTGIGLDIVRAIASAHQGVALIEDRPGKGAVAKLILPNIKSTDPEERRRVLHADLAKVYSSKAAVIVAAA
jgi:hypothetical protein